MQQMDRMYRQIPSVWNIAKQFVQEMQDVRDLIMIKISRSVIIEDLRHVTGGKMKVGIVTANQVIFSFTKSVNTKDKMNNQIENICC